MLSENKFTKYLIYAIGEIILVVIVILIALQVNNWNQNQKDKSKMNALLHELAVSLIEEVDQSEAVLEAYYRKDSLIHLQLTNQFDEDDFQVLHPESPRLLLLNRMSVPINTIAYDQIKSMIDRIPIGYEHLIDEIKHLYEIDIPRVISHQESISTNSSNFRNSLIENQSWFIEIERSKLSPEAINYFLEDPIYQNHVKDFDNTGKNYWSLLNQFRARGIYVLSLIAQMEKMPIVDGLNEKPYFIDSKLAEHISGQYRIPQFNNHEFSISRDKSRLYVSLFDLQGEAELVSMGDNVFNYPSRFIQVKINEPDTNMISLVGADGSTIVCEKIE